MLVQNLPCICFGSCLGDSETTRVWQTSKMFPKGGAIVFDFEKPKIEIAEISEDKRYGKFVVEPLEEAMVPH